ncbi:MAG: c-type cytochrome [Bacteroidota bacterium]
MEEQNKRPDKEINYRDVLTNPVRWFGLIYPFFIVVIIAGGIFYLDKINILEENEREKFLIELPDINADIQMKPGKELEGVVLEDYVETTEELLAQGAELYTSSCASCHGDQGQGNGPAGAGLDPQPRDFTDPSDWTVGKSFSAIYRTLEEGVEGTSMTAYDYMPVEDRIAIVHYIRENFMREPPEITRDELKELDREYSIAEGRKQAAQIPVSSAMRILVQESRQDSAKITNILSIIEAHDFEGAEIFRKISSDKRAAVITLSRNKAWQQSPAEFISILRGNLPENGFRADILKLNESELAMLHSYLKGFFNIAEEA